MEKSDITGKDCAGHYFLATTPVFKAVFILCGAFQNDALNVIAM